MVDYVAPNMWTRIWWFLDVIFSALRFFLMFKLFATKLRRGACIISVVCIAKLGF
jgi:hypothetical protein